MRFFPLLPFISLALSFGLATGTSPAAPVRALVLPRSVSPHPSGRQLLPPGAQAVDLVRMHLHDLGEASSMTPVDVAVTLHYRNEAQLAALIQAQSDPTSPLFSHFLTNMQFDNEFAPLPSSYQAVLMSLEMSGFRIKQTYANDTVIDATAPVMTVERYFNTQIHSVQTDRGVRFANVLPAMAPLNVRGLILHVDGLNNLAVLHTNFATVASQHTGVKPFQRAATAAAPIYGPVSSITGLAGYGPTAFTKSYDFPAAHGYTGTGRASGIAIDADYLDSDLKAFLSYFGVIRTGPPTVRVPIDGGPPTSDGSADSVEATMDVETTVGLAPGTKLYVYEFPSFNSLTYITDTYNKVVSDNLIDSLSSSFGGCELLLSDSAKAWDAIAEQGAAKGITFEASTGDAGALPPGCVQQMPSGNLVPMGVEAPASGSNFVAVGGTSLDVNTDGSWRGESGWGGSTGGASGTFPVPSWQVGITHIIASGRNVPDVSFDADPYYGTAFYYGGSWNTAYDPLGGTSLSSPMFGAAITEIDQVKQKRLGLAGRLLTNLWHHDGYGTGIRLMFHDCLSGFNAYYYCAAGYDQVTGIGSADLWDVARALK